MMLSIIGYNSDRPTPEDKEWVGIIRWDRQGAIWMCVRLVLDRSFFLLMPEALCTHVLYHS